MRKSSKSLTPFLQLLTESLASKDICLGWVTRRLPKLDTAVQLSSAPPCKFPFVNSRGLLAKHIDGPLQATKLQGKFANSGRSYSGRPTPGSSLTDAKGRFGTPLSSPRRPSIIKPIAFCGLTSTAAFTYAAFSEENKYRLEWEQFKSRPLFGRQKETEISDWVARMPTLLQNLYREFWWELTPPQRAVSLIVGLNLAVFGAFKILPAFVQGFMARNFIHHLPPYSNRVYTLLTANFAHLNLWHLGFNMLAFLSFGREAARMFGFEQFLAFYLSAGLASGLASHLGRINSKTGGFSLGASGAVYACFAATAMTKPNTEVVMILLPWFPIKIGDALNVMLILDVAGVLLGWRRFDHFGHLGGALFGLWYTAQGQQLVWPRFQQLVEDVMDRSDSKR